MSSQNKAQLNSLKVEWVELRGNEGYKRFQKILSNLKIPHKKLTLDLDNKLDQIIEEIFK